MRYSFKIGEEFVVNMRPFTVEDMEAECYQEAFHDPDVTRYNSHGLFPYTKTKREAFARDLEDSTSRIVWAICVKDSIGNEVVIGNCALQGINWVNRSAEFAIVIWDKEYWGRSVATGALCACIKHAFNRLGLNRVWSGTARPNQPMQKVFEKVGMKKEGEFRQGMFLHGEFQDVMCYGILVNDRGWL